MSSPRKAGSELQTIKQPQKVKVLILSESRASFKDFYLIASFVRLIKIDLSYNKLSSFPPGFSFKPFMQLRTLFLHYNKFSAIKQLLPVAESQSLHYLTLFGNPLEEAKARHFFINQVGTLMLMDDKTVRLDQRNPEFNLRECSVPLLTFPLVPTPSQGEQSKIYIEILIQELVVARKNYLKANPVVLIQRWWRHWRRKSQRKWKNTLAKPPEEPIQRQSSLKQYKENLQEIEKEEKKEEDLAVPQTVQKVCWLLRANRGFWECMEKLVSDGRVLLSREYCHLRGIHFQQIPLIVIRKIGNITGTPLAQARRLTFLQRWHMQLIARSHPIAQKKETPRQISLKLSQEYKINRNRFTHYQQKLIKREETYHHFVLPLLTKEELISIVRKEYWRSIRAFLRDTYCQLPFLLEGLARRVIAAVSIQRRWRGFKVRKSVNAFLKMKEKESAIRIQRWVRRLPFIHRHKFLLQVSHYLKTQRNTADITLEMSQLEAIQAYATYKENHSYNFAIPFQQCSFTINRHAPGRILFHAPCKPYPPYLGLSFTSGQGEVSVGKSSILQVLFKQVKEVSKVTDSKGVKFVKLSYQSVEEAINRKFVLALKTYRMLNHQFIRSRDPPIVPPQYVVDIIAEINQNRLISVAYDKDCIQEETGGKGSMESSARQLEGRRSLVTVGSDLGMIGGAVSLRIKYFIMKTDHSCTFLLREPNYQRQSKHPMQQLQLNQFYLPHKSSRRYVPEEFPSDLPSKISRNILSLEDMNPFTHRRESAGYLNVLSTDQSHTNLEEPSPQYRSLNRLMSYRKSDSFDKFDKQVYPATTEVRESRKWEAGEQGLKQKREKIEEIKAAHKKNIHSISLQKTENLNNLRRSVRKESEERLRSIDYARNLLEQQKARKHDRVREHFRQSPSDFEKEFLKKGMSSIKRGFRDYQKNHSLRNPLPEPSPPQNLKTEIKEFSLTFDQEQPTLKDSLKKEAPGTSSNPTNKSQVTEASPKQESLPVSPPNEKEEPTEEAKAKDLQRKKLRKKRLVHSVFPEEFYPIKQANQIGFQLPKIIKK